MKRIFPALVFFAAFCFSRQLGAQVVNDSLSSADQMSQQLENLSESIGEENPDFTSLVEDLTYYAKHPVNLNTATREELEDLGLLNEIQITNLLQHRDKFGPLINVYELQTVDGFDLETIFSILPYIYVSDMTAAGHFSFKLMLKDGSSDLTLREQRVLETQKGYTFADSTTLAKNPNARYLGSPDHLYARYHFSYGNFVSFNITGEKDAGEQFFRGANKNGFDFYSAHLAVRNVGHVKSLVIGDYQANFGQGLTVWTGYAFGKTSMTLNTKRTASGIRPYNSVDENKFMRGIAGTMRFGKFEGTAFFSRKLRDANITASDTIGKNIDVLEFSSLQTTGLHTTPGEIADKDAIMEMLYGGNLAYKGKHFQFGITGMHSGYNADFKRSLSLYNEFQFTARSNDVIGADYDWLFRNFHFFGEESRSSNGGYAFVNGVLVSLDPRLAITVFHRYLGRDFQNIYASAFSENTTVANENGIYFGLQAQPFRRISVNAYIDRYIFPWLQYQVNAPSHGSDFLVQANFVADKKTLLYFRYRHRDRFTNAKDAAAPLDYIVPLTNDDWRFNIVYPAGKIFSMGTRVEFTIYHRSNANPEKGFLIYQDVKFKLPKSRIAFTGRYALFQTDTYNAAIYTYENEIPGYFLIPAYYYRGSRIYGMISYSFSRHIEAWVRISQTYYTNQTVISSGSLDQINGNTKTMGEVELKIRW